MNIVMTSQDIHLIFQGNADVYKQTDLSLHSAWCTILTEENSPYISGLSEF